MVPGRIWRQADDIDVAGDKASYVKLPRTARRRCCRRSLPQIDFPAALAFVMQLINQLRRRQPEMAVGDLQLLRQHQRRVVAQVLKQAESRHSLDVRPGYDHAFIRAIQMGLSIGMTDALPGFDVGAGTGEGSGRSCV
jgi:hypothetical protein